MEKKLENPEKGDEKVTRYALPQEEAARAVAASVGPRKEGRCNQGTVGILEGPSATFGA